MATPESAWCPPMPSPFVATAAEPFACPPLFRTASSGPAHGGPGRGPDASAATALMPTERKTTMSCRKFLGAAALSLVAGIATAAPFPERELTGVIMWGAGGATDVVARAVTPPAEEALGKKIVLVNKSGGTGAISTNFVNNAPSDGYTVLYGAENPQLHQVLGIADFGYEKFYPVNILGRGVAVIVVKNDAPWNSLKDFVEDAKKRPGKLKMGSTGPGGLPHTVGSMLNSITKFQVISVPFDGEGPGLTALLGGHVDMMPVGSGAAAENIKAGRVKALAVVDSEALPMQGSPSIPPITRDYPEFAKYLPWGPFYGVFVKRDTPDDVKATLVKAFKAAAANPQFVTLMKDRGNVMMNTSRRRSRRVPEEVAVGDFVGAAGRGRGQGFAREIRHRETLTAGGARRGRAPSSAMWSVIRQE